MKGGESLLREQNGEPSLVRKILGQEVKDEGLTTAVVTVGPPCAGGLGPEEVSPFRETEERPEC